MADPRGIFAFNPMGTLASTWWQSQNRDGNSGTGALSTGVSYIAGGGADPTHPFASTLSERIIKCDGNDATSHQFQVASVFGGGTGTGLTISPNYSNGATPSGTKRWAACLASFLLYWNGTLPNANALLAFEGGANPWQLLLTTGGQLSLTVEGSAVATSASALTSAAWVQMEVWEVYKNASGGTLSPHQFVVRQIANLTTTRTYSTYLNVTASRTSAGFNPANILNFGEGTARGAGFVYYLGNITRCWDDGDNPMGVRRIDQQLPSAAKGVGHDNDFTGNCANVNEVLPDDDTTKDSLTIDVSHTPRSQTYKLVDPAYIAAADFVAGGTLSSRAYFTTGAKGVVNTLAPVISDGTTDGALASPSLGSVYTTSLRSFDFAPSGSRYVLATLKTMEVGATVTSTDSAINNDLNKLTTFAVQDAYVKSGESGTALPAYPGGARRRIFVI